MKKKKNGKEILENQKLEETTITQTHKVIPKGRYIFNTIFQYGRPPRFFKWSPFLGLNIFT